MLIKEFIQVLRDARMKAVIFLMPIVQLIIFGYAVTTDIRNVPTAIYDLDNSVASRELIARFEQSGYFTVTSSIDDPADAHALLDHGEVSAVIQINHGFAGNLRAGKTTCVQILIDGTDSNTAGIILNYSNKIVRALSRKIHVTRYTQLKGPGLRPPEVLLHNRAWYNENLESRNFYVPGVISILVTLITLMLTSMAIVREKEIGTMEQIMVTPITSTEFILGKTVPFSIIGFVDVILITVVGVFWFNVPIRGNLLLLFVATGLYLMSTLGVGLIISTVSNTQQQAMMSTFFFFFLLSCYRDSCFPSPICRLPYNG